MINYSIIIPHRDSFQLLERAVRSIPVRKDIEIIVVDNSLKSVDFESLHENPILKVLFSDVNKGAGHARNIGIENAIGKWFLFLDADDFFNSGAFEKFDEYVKTSSDIVFFGSNSVYNSEKLEKANRHKNYLELVRNYCRDRNSWDAENNLRYKYFTPWSKLIKANLITRQNIEFEEIPASNDLMFSTRIGHYARSIEADEFPAYCVTVSPTSLTQTVTKENSRSRYMAAIRQNQFMIKTGKTAFRLRLFSLIIRSLKFGIGEFFWYLRVLIKYKINPLPLFTFK